MAPEADLYDYRVFGDEGRMTPTEAVTAAIKDAINEGCDIINMSLGGRNPDWDMQNAMRKAYNAGVIMVVAAGNYGDNDVLTIENS